MSDPIITKSEITVKEPVHVSIEIKKEQKEEDDECKCEKCFGVRITCLDIWIKILGTIVLGGLGLLISYFHNQSQDDLAKYNSDVKLITSVNFDTTLAVQLKTLYSIQPFIITKEIKNIVISRIDSIYITLHTPIKVASFINEDSVANYQAKIPVVIKTQLDQLVIRDTVKTQQPINNLKDKENNIVGTLIPAIDTIASKKLFENNILSSPKAIDNYVLVGDRLTQWCKKGYYIEFNSSLRIGINDLNNSGQTININLKDIEIEPDTGMLIKDDVTLTVDQTYTLDYKTYRYQITLNYIGAAGRNPFTKAAYITVATYKKS